MGVRKTTDFLEKATWTLAGGMMILCVLATFFIPRGENAVKSAIQEQIEAQPVQQQTIPTFPTNPGAGENAQETGAATPGGMMILCVLAFFLYFSMIYIFFPPLPFCRIFFGTKYDKKEML